MVASAAPAPGVIVGHPGVVQTVHAAPVAVHAVHAAPVAVHAVHAAPVAVSHSSS